MRNKRGFTIIELLIVIVVIAILATITVVAYSGIQQRSKNTNIESAANTYVKALIAYKNTNGAYPASTSTCVGAVADYPNPNPSCYSANPSVEMENGLRTVISSQLPIPDPNCINTSGSICYRNYSYLYAPTWKIDGQPHANYFWYFLYGNASCNLSNSLEPPYTNFSSIRNNGYYSRSNGSTICVIALPD